jgi:hypothetical protein
MKESLLPSVTAVAHKAGASSDNIIMNIDGKDIEMRYPICFGKVYDKWLVSECGKVWSLYYNKLIKGSISYSYSKKSKAIRGIVYTIMTVEEDWWGDGSANKHHKERFYQRHMTAHKMVMDTWKPLYDNPPEGVVWEEWEIVRDLPSVYNHISKTVVIDHIDDNPANNHIDNLRRVTSWDNNSHRKAKGI